MTATTATTEEAEQREAIRARVTESRRKVGLPPHVEDESVLDAIARVLRR